MEAEGDDEVADAPLFHVFQRLDEREVAVALEPVAVINVVELVVVHADLLAHPGELAQELAIVLLLARHGAQVHGKVRALDAPQLRVGVKLHAHLVGRALPLLLGPI